MRVWNIGRGSNRRLAFSIASAVAPIRPRAGCQAHRQNSKGRSDGHCVRDSLELFARHDVPQTFFRVSGHPVSRDGVAPVELFPYLRGALRIRNADHA